MKHDLGFRRDNNGYIFKYTLVKDQRHWIDCVVSPTNIIHSVHALLISIDTYKKVMFFILGKMSPCVSLWYSELEGNERRKGWCY